jgi:hypothetical protein
LMGVLCAITAVEAAVNIVKPNAKFFIVPVLKTAQYEPK